MLSILIVDDDPVKIRQILEVLTGVAEISSSDIKIAEDLISARDLVRTVHFDLLILDIRLPNRKGDAPSNSAGCDFIKELNASQTLLRPYHIIGLTAYQDILADVDPFFYDEVWRIIKYDPKSIDWRRQLSHKLLYLVLSKKELSFPSNLPYYFDVGIITALVEPELKAVLQLPANWNEVKFPSDGTIFHTGLFSGPNRSLKVVAASSHQMGVPATSVLAMKMHNHFRPHYLVMTGIAAGISSTGAAPGDILVADQTWDYQSGKNRVLRGLQIFDPDPKPIPLSTEIKERLLHLQSSRDYLDLIQKGWKGATPPSPLNVLIGPLATGNTVIQDSDLIEQLKSRNRKLIGIDMETYGLFYVADNCCRPKPVAISMKSVSDFADSAKSDDFQAYASYTSSNYLYHFAINHLMPVAP